MFNLNGAKFMRNTNYIRSFLIFSVCLALSGCPVVRASGDAVKATGQGIGHAVEGTGDAIGRAGREMAN